MEISGALPQKEMKLGIKIEQPKNKKIHPIYALVVLLSLVFIAATIGLLFMEYIGEPLPFWLRSALNQAMPLSSM